MAGGAAQQSADARQHLLHVERFGDIIVGAGVEALHLVAPAVTGGQDKHRHVASGRAPFFENGHAVLLWQADVEDDGVVGLRLAEMPAFFAVESAVHRVAGLFERANDLAVQILVVFNDEQPQCVLPASFELSCLQTQNGPGR